MSTMKNIYIYFFYLRYFNFQKKLFKKLNKKKKKINSFITHS